MESRTRTAPDVTSPHRGGIVRFDGGEWRITDQATYSTAAGYRVHEWACESGGVSAYLLKENEPGVASPRWFFTREIPTKSVTAGGEALASAVAAHANAPPAVLEYDGGTYRYEDTTDGLHEDDGGAVRKITWDYWDAARRKNLAVERWPDGSLATYIGSYIEPGQFTTHSPKSAHAGRLRQGHPIVLFLLSLTFGYALCFVIGQPFDNGFVKAIYIAATVSWFSALIRVPLTALAGAGLATAAAGLFWLYPPLTSWMGLATVCAVPALVGWVAKLRNSAAHRQAVQFVGALAVAVPLVVVGSLFYFWFAPGPHTPDQFWLALGPAAIAAAAGFLIAGLVLGRDS